MNLHLCNTSVPATMLILGIQGLLRPTFLPLGSLESREGGGQTEYYFTAVGTVIKGSMKCSGRIHIVVESLSHIRLCDPMECSTPCFPVLHYFPGLLKLMSIELVIPPSHLIFSHLLLLLPSVFPKISFISSEPALGIRWPQYWPLQHQSLPMNIQGWFPLALTGLISLLSKGLSRVFSSTTVWKHQFFGTHPCLWSNSHIHTQLPEKP